MSKTRFWQKLPRKRDTTMVRPDRTPWTEDDDNRLRDLRVDDTPWPEIADDLKRTAEACRGRWHILKVQDAIASGKPSQRGMPESTERRRDELFRARQQQDPLQRHFGDPPPGFSALDRKRTGT